MAMIQTVGKTREPRDPDDEIIRRNLEKFRVEAGYSQAQISEMSGVPVANYARYERGENAVPAKALMAIADAYGRSTDDFRSPNPGPPKAEPPTFTLRARPGVDVDQEVYERLVAEVERANREVRGKKSKR